MSRLIDVDVAKKIVEECCKKHNPVSKVKARIQSAIIEVTNALQQATPPLEAGIGIFPGVRPAGPKPVQVGQTGRVTLPAVPGGQASPAGLASLAGLKDALIGIRNSLDKEDPCFAMMGCVAKGFREKMLPSVNKKRTLYVDKSFASHFIPAGTQIDRKRLRHVRR